MQLNFPNQMDPHFFAYGSFPIYLIYFTNYVVNFFQKTQPTFEQIIIVSRFYSAILSLILIPSVYFVGKKLVDRKVGLFAAVACTFSTGLIQFAHFGTVEIWLAFLGLWLFYFSFVLVKQLKFRNIFIISLIYGLLVATKISSIPLLIIPLTSIFLHYLPKIKLIKFALYALLIISLAFVVFTITSPYVFMDFSSFVSSMKYESSVALGALPVFYTGEFFNSIPVLFQFTKIYPFLINPLMTTLFIPALIYLTFIAYTKNNKSYLLLVACFLLFFLPQAFLFAKWTRYMLPTLPFMILIISIALDYLLKKNALSIKHFALSAIIFVGIIFSISYFFTFAKQDTRIEASFWAKENISANSSILSEVYDMGIVPFNTTFHRITLFNFYDLDQIPDKSPELKKSLSENEYIILPSQRILKTRMLNPDNFPVGNNFYKDLFNGKLGFQKIYESNCDIFCKITYLGNPVFSLEQTANVFDRPTVFIFKKI